MQEIFLVGLGRCAFTGDSGLVCFLCQRAWYDPFLTRALATYAGDLESERRGREGGIGTLVANCAKEASLRSLSLCDGFELRTQPFDAIASNVVRLDGYNWLGTMAYNSAAKLLSNFIRETT